MLCGFAPAPLAGGSPPARGLTFMFTFISLLASTKLLFTMTFSSLRSRCTISTEKTNNGPSEVPARSVAGDTERVKKCLWPADATADKCAAGLVPPLRFQFLLSVRPAFRSPAPGLSHLSPPPLLQGAAPRRPGRAGEGGPEAFPGGRRVQEDSCFTSLHMQLPRQTPDTLSVATTSSAPPPCSLHTNVKNKDPETQRLPPNGSGFERDFYVHADMFVCQISPLKITDSVRIRSSHLPKLKKL